MPTSAAASSPLCCPYFYSRPCSSETRIFPCASGPSFQRLPCHEERRLIHVAAFIPGTWHLLQSCLLGWGGKVPPSSTSPPSRQISRPISMGLKRKKRIGPERPYCTQSVCGELTLTVFGIILRRLGRKKGWRDFCTKGKRTK